MICSVFIFVITQHLSSIAHGYNGDPKILLKDVNVLTLHKDKMTTARRSSPVPQMSCVGGSASNQHHLIPDVIQCRNKGTDGFDVQWECKADMDSSMRFGKIEVTCEGYDYPNDPYILKGSCGLEFNLEKIAGAHTGYKNSRSAYTDLNYKATNFSDIAMILGCFVVMYLIYRYWISSRNCNLFNVDDDDTQHPRHSNNDSMGDEPPPYAPPPYTEATKQQPPPAGFRPEYMSHDAGRTTGGRSYAQDTGRSHTQEQNRPQQQGFNFSNFFTGAATGGLLGYFLGNRGDRGHNRPYSSSWGSNSFGGNSWGSGGFGGGFGSSSASSSGSSGGTHTSSGFGGTRRR